MKVAATLIVAIGISTSAFAQGTPSILRCSFQGGLDLRRDYEPLSPVVTRVACGSTVLVIDQRFGTVHLRTESGQDGYIQVLNLGQFRFDPVTVQPSQLAPVQPLPQPIPQPVPVAVVPQPTAAQPAVVPFQAPPNQPQFAPESSFRRFEIAWNVFDFQRQQTDVSLWGGVLSFAVQLNQRLAIVAELGSHEATDTGRLATFRAGPRFRLGDSEKVRPFFDVLVGAARASEKYSLFGASLEVSQNFFTGSVGGGFDVRIRDWVAWRAIQGGYSMMYSSEGGLSNGFRLGTGVVFRFGRS